MSMSLSYRRSISVAALAFVFALPFATAHGASPPPPSSVPGAASPSPYLATGAGAQATTQAEGPASVEDLGRGVMAALRQGSFDALLPHLPTAEVLQEVLAEMLTRGEMTEEQAQQNTSQIPEIVEAIQASLRDDYEQIQALAAHEEVSWEQAEITGYDILLRDYDTGESRAVDTATLAAMETEQLLGAQIHVRFAAGGDEHELSLGDCVRTSRGWLIMERFGWSSEVR